MGIIRYTIQPYDTLWLIAQRYNTTINAIAAANPGVNLNFLRVGQVINICPGHGHYPISCWVYPGGISKSEFDLNNALRMLWEEHIVWTRLAIISIIGDMPDADVVINRLLRNPIDFEEALKPYYGAEKTSEFGDLLKDHLVIAAELVRAAKAGKSKEAADAEKRWYANADEIAAFLGRINPYWSKEEWKSMLHEHLALTKSEAVNILSKDYEAGVNVYDEIQRQALMMADVMRDGIVRQFPDKFPV
jgi:hypothetical protein